jgi:RHS repeat-associated protein
VTDRRWLIADERGSIVAVTDQSGAAFNINRYDEYGIPAPYNLGRFGYTGQAWLPEVGLYYYKARFYSPTLGRFLQTDPIGFGDGVNWYNYVGGDPVNKSDPSGLAVQVNCPEDSICVTAPAYDPPSRDDHFRFDNIRMLFDRNLNDWRRATHALELEIAEIAGNVMTAKKGKSCHGPLRQPSTNMMTAATNLALNSVPGGGRASPLTSEFSKIANLPNFRSGGWRAVGSTHSASAFEHDLGNTGKAVKVYIGDSNFNGRNTVTITDPTNSVGHYAAFPAFVIGMTVNARNAAVYLSQVGC